MKTNIKIIATSLALVSSVGAWAGIGGLNVQSHLGQPFSGSIVVTGDEAEALKSNRRVTVSGSGIRGTVVPQSNGNVVVRLRSSSPIREPMITFTVSAGRQTREYTAMLDPSGYTPQLAPSRAEKPVKEPKRKPQPVATEEPTSPRSGVKAGQRDFIERNGQVPAHSSTVQTNTLPDEDKPARPTTKKEREPRPARETTSRDSTPATTGAVNQVRKSGKAAVTARRHRAQAGETLSSIAERYRPRNMSLQTASRALAMANPSAFKRGNTIQRNTTLYIPSASQWHAYAQRAQSYQAPQRPATPPRRATAPQVQAPVDALPDQTPVAQPQPTVQPQPAQQPAAQQPKPAQPVAQPQPAPQPAAQQPKPAQPAGQPQPAQQPAAQQPKPAQPAAQPAATTPSGQPAAPAPQPLNAPTAQPAAQQPTAPAAPTSGQPAPTPIKAAPASTPAQAASAVAASKASTAVASSVAASNIPMPSTQPAPTASQDLPPPAVTEPADEGMEESETDWVLYGGGVGAALAVAAGAAYFLRKRRSENAADDEDEDVTWETDTDNASAASGIAKAATAATVAAATSTHDDHDFDVNADDSDFETMSDNQDESDDVFFATEASTEPKPFNLNDFEPDAASLEKDLIATSAVTDPDDDWVWDTPTASSTTPDDIEQLSAVGKVDNDSDWSLDSDEDESFADDDFSLDKIDQLEKELLDNELNDAAFSEFGKDDDFIQPASNTSPKSAAVDDIDAMFANALANLDGLTSEAETQPAKPKPAAAELDDIDAMFAGALANLGSNKKAVEEDAFDAEDIDSLSAIGHLEDDELAAALEQPKAKPAAAELDDIDAMFAGALANLDSLAHDTHEDDALMAEAELENLHSLGELDEILPTDEPTKSADELVDALFAEQFSEDLTATATNPSAAADELDALFANQFGEDLATTATNPSAAADELDALFADELDDLATNQSGEQAVAATDPIDDIDALFANELNELENLNHEAEYDDSLDNAFAEFSDEDVPPATQTAVNTPDDIDALFADELESLNSLSELNDLDHELSASHAELNDLNTLSEFGELATLESSMPAPVAAHDDIDALFANALSDINEPLANEPVIKPIMSEEDIENFNSLSELDHLEANEPTADDLFADALGGLVAGETATNDIHALAFEAPVIDAAITDELATSENVDAMAFDLSAFDALQNTATEAVAEEVAFDDVNAMAFDLSGFDALTDAPAVEEPALDDVDALAFAAPEIPDTVLETPELSTPAIDFDVPDLTSDLPDELADLEQLAASLDDLETTDEFADFDTMSSEGAGFVSGAVGTGETLEAKLELAKMYIEIEDMDTARGMLNELLADADGEIGVQAKALLAQIG